MKKSAKKWLIVATALIITGGVIFASVMFACGWDFTKLNTDNYRTHTYEIDDDFDDISINTDTADICFALSNDEGCKIECYENENEKHSVTVENHSLLIELNSKKAWYDNIGINFSSTKITIFLPKKMYNSLIIKEHTGNIVLPKDLCLKTVETSLSTGDVNVSASISELLKIKTSTGDVNVNNVVTETLDITTSTGDINVDYCDAKKINLKASTGNITGQLLSNKTFNAETSTGNIDLPETSVGDQCNITTSTGDIKISIVK